MKNSKRIVRERPICKNYPRHTYFVWRGNTLLGMFFRRKNARKA